MESLLGLSWDSSQVIYWLKEDLPSFDYGGFVVGNKIDEAILYMKTSGIVAGEPFVTAIFKELGCSVEWKIYEGSFVSLEKETRKEVAIVRGEARKLLAGERTALNVLARCSGIATLAKRVNQIALNSNFKGKIAGTRKTTPGFRIVEKYALLIGGCDTHRMDLSSMIMLKDNHIWSTGSIKNAVSKARSVGGFSLKIEVECQSQEEAEEAINAGADVIMLDNFSPEKLKATAKILKLAHPHILIEASGGVILETLKDYFSDDIDIISMGNLTQGVSHIDFSLKIKH